ncbi:signal transduction histidine kinase [Halospina denitrificans]|uniref:Sensory/regulatory protein RpfC n=1 Tax=Halospina denitrificans TaxID=332522 RepID=A0A4R7JNJ2_9GAMM|nr:ATP-binding protein [Halospina denitrificans]TDT39415.1 signal transduction histidine kinase [Halospina denitrificans]
MKSDLSRRLSFRLTRNVVLSALTLGLLLNLAVVTADYFNARSTMDSEVSALIEISHSPASQIAYNIDTRLAEELLDGLLRHPAIIKARIEDSRGRILASRERELRDGPYRWLSDYLFEPEKRYQKELHVSQLEDMDLGNLMITVDTYPFGSNFLQRAGYTLLSGFIMSLALAVLLLFIFYTMITKPLLRIVNGLRDVDSDKAEKARLPTPRRHEEDEIGLLVRITNDHLDTIDNSLQKLRHAEGRLKEYNDKLAQIVEARTSEIRDKNEALQRSNRALIDAREEALEMARARADFLASMSHEIRTPLNGMLGMLRLTLEGELSNTQRERTEVALSAGENLVSLVNDILDISKVEAGKLTLENISLDLGALAEECATLFAQQGVQGGRVDIVTRIAPELPRYYRGDPTRLRQIINNLMGNAIKFTSEGQVELILEATEEGVCLQVQDSGIGMSRDAQKTIFSAFSQGHSDTTRRFGGTGLGLTLCRQLVDRMGGTIRVASEENRGTLITVDLPLETDPEAEGYSGEEDFADMQVLLLASPANRHVEPLERYLEYWGAVVTRREKVISEPGDLNARAFDLIITDVREPGWLSLVKRLERHPPLVHLGRNLEDPPISEVIQLPLARRQLVNTLRINTGLRGLSSEAVDLPSQSTTRLKVLLVEDNRVNQLVASGMVRKLGHSVELAENGQEALRTLEQGHYDLVLMDCQMPVMDGFEATRRIRGTPAIASIPVIAVTANAMQGDREGCLEAGMDDYLTKPYSLDAMRTVLERWVPGDGT